MKKLFSMFITLAILFFFVGCSRNDIQEEIVVPSESATEETVVATEPVTTASSEETQRQIIVQFEDNTIIYELNDSSAADSLLAMLPLTIEIEDYSTNEKIFYPESALDTSDTPLATSGSGTLAYYDPWDDVVFFYGDYNENPGLFELGQVVSGEELISQMSGTISIKIAN